MTHVEAYTKVWVEGRLVASTRAASDYVPPMTADNLTEITLQAAREAVSKITKSFPASAPEQGKGQTNAVQ